ncbi:hypothetical protein BV22DRAFT_1034419 [Leucogyrophana mollusca]|uniref:Uncharacterized protein n=1 Tax=Leucogyrophana mollusca TaxID=85980 RepID=A0ACB8BH70_9AGAM|nr:hypothetical protein BV22DRAFT_1034419 [Leucogyrophana mollusca]
MYPSRINRQQPHEHTFSERYWHHQSPRARFIIASAVLMAAATGAYYWGYRDVEERHNPNSRTLKKDADRRYKND